MVDDWVASPMQPQFFETPAEFRKWLAKNQATASELWVGFHKVDSGKPSISWPQSVDQALCFGWIDGQRKSLGPTSYAIRFTPRKPTSNWSAVNVKRYQELLQQGLVEPSGEAAFARRDAQRTAVYGYENRSKASLAQPELERFRSDSRAWRFFESCPPSYQTAAKWWVVSSKRPETRERRLAQLIQDSAAGRRVAPLSRPEPAARPRRA